MGVHTECSVRGGVAALCQITLTTCLFWLYKNLSGLHLQKLYAFTGIGAKHLHN